MSKIIHHFLHSPIIRLTVIVFLLITGSSGWNASAYQTPEKTSAWQGKVEPQVLSAAASGETDFLVYLNEQADLSGASSLHTKQEKGTYVFQNLVSTALRTQAPILESLEKGNVPHRSFWVVNMIWVRGDLSTVQTMARRSDIAHIYADPWVRNDSIDLSTSNANSEYAVGKPSANQSPSGIEWNITKVNAPQVWAAGYTGQGTVIGGQDTGYQWDHPALINKYRGWDGISADHNYNWHDAIHEDNPNSSGDNSCGLDLSIPCDDYGHGTHTMGTMVGDDGNGKQIGMAPGAQWIGCRNMEERWGKPSTYTECFQWFIAPWPIGGDPVTDADPSKAPDVISNSWACPTSGSTDEGCEWDTLQTIVNNTRAAGIMVVGSAGNYGMEGCGSVKFPISIYDGTFSVGATDSDDVIADFSSRGPSDNTNLLKPDISAPGVNVYSSYLGNSYTTKEGTSMAAPHVSGLVALLISVNPGLAGQVDTLENIITQSAVPLTDTVTCGGIPGTSIPNNTYGWGRIDAYAAYQSVHHLSIEKSASSTYLDAGDLITYTLTISHSLSISPTTGVIITDILPADTLFITATIPYTLENNQITWELPSLDGDESRNLQLVLQVPITQTGIISNQYYGVKSDDFLMPALGEPVIVFVGYLKFFPFSAFQP